MTMNPIPAWITFGCLLWLFTACLPRQSSAAAIPADGDLLPVTGFSSRAMPGGAPEGWTLLQYRGDPVMTMQKDEDHHYLRMISSEERAFGIRKEISVDLREYPYLNWQWRVNRLPPEGDIRRADRDDQALQIYLIFKTPGTMLSFQEPSLSYIWDSRAPRGLMVGSPQRSMDTVRYIVVRSGTEALGQWHWEKRNVSTDSRNAFINTGKSQPLEIIRGILLFINTHHTKGKAEADMGEIFFSRN